MHTAYLYWIRTFARYGMIFVLRRYMKITLLTLAVCFLHTIVLAQDDLSHEIINSSRIKRPVVKAAVTSIVNYSEALLPIAVEYRINRVVSAEVEIGIPLFFNAIIYKNSNGTTKDLHSDIKYRANLRGYFPSQADNAGFIGIDGSMRKQKYTLHNGEYFGSYGYKNSYATMDISKTVYTLNLIVGMQANISRRLFAEIFSGLGVKEVQVTKGNITGFVQGREENKFHIGLPVGEGEDRNLGGRFINIPFALRICYRL